MSSQEHELSSKIVDMVDWQKNLLKSLEEVLPHKAYINYVNLLDYVCENKFKTYYPIVTLREASQCENDKELLELVLFFCGSTSNFFRITYCYYNEDDTEEPISAEGYFNALIKDEVPRGLNSGRHIEGFDKSYISFYCNLNLKCKTQTL
ncbi:hypothetical protein [Pantoea sp. At-9b]|uniref:hypothetical protein n=1 Tax=Pantoea sp. (strain At-9b) TaxID=592316 RepID=UPI0001B3E534|nr:hypothetical protein [Pantoea sp. At-9b]ADU71572.1 hypothetical protein Pat9b_5415 [Pantoea sp. At-9b]